MRFDRTLSILFLTFALSLAACGREESVATKSARAYDEAKSKGVEISGGHDHGSHTAATSTTTTSAIDHSAHGARR